MPGLPLCERKSSKVAQCRSVVILIFSDLSLAFSKAGVLA